jgi:hypothetical protein
MQDKPNGAGDDERATTAQDRHDQRRVLREVLFQRPETLTVDELVRELTIDSTEFSEQDRIRRAVRDLIAGGLLHKVGDLVLPTRAAALYHSLDD